MQKRCLKELPPDELLAYKRELSRIRNQRYRDNNKEHLRELRASKKDKQKALARSWYERNREKTIKKQRAYYQANKEKVIAYVREYNKKNRATIVPKQTARLAERRKDPVFDAKHRAGKVASIMRRRERDPSFKAVCNLRCRLKDTVRKLGVLKIDKFSALLGCTLQDFKTHLESQFEPWMNWSNYGFGDGKWVVDHIVALSKHDLGDPEEQRKSFHFKNLRPLCWRKNMEKSDG